MRVLMVSTNRSQAMVPPFPLGLACVIAGLDKGRHTVKVWDAMFETDWRASLTARLKAFQPEVIGLSIRNVEFGTAAPPGRGFRVEVTRGNCPRETLVSVEQRLAARVVGQREAIARVASIGLPSGHSLYITFRSDFPGVDMPDWLKAQYPEAMTIVLEQIGVLRATWELRDGQLADIAPTVLALMQLPQPREMTGRALLPSTAKTAKTGPEQRVAI